MSPEPLTIRDSVIAALDLPTSALVEQRVPKKLLLENGAPTTADKRRISEGVEELFWVAALKPTTAGVPEFRDAVRAYLEIAVIRLTLRPEAKAVRLVELVHRAIPYPLVLVLEQEGRVGVSLAHLRWSQAEVGATVLESAPTLVWLDPASTHLATFLAALPLTQQPRTELFALYDAWLSLLHALEAATQTGTFVLPRSPEHAAQRRAALAECVALEAELTQLRAAASKEKQLARRVELNLELQRVSAQLAATRQSL